MRDDIAEGISRWIGSSPRRDPGDHPVGSERSGDDGGRAEDIEEPDPGEPVPTPDGAGETTEETEFGEQPMMTYTVKELKLSDRALLDRILDQFQPGWEDDLAPGATGSLAFMADSATFAFGAFLGPDAVGYAWGYRLRLPTGRRSLLLHDLEVGNEHRRQGLGGLLLQAVLNLGQREGCAQVWLVTEADNQAAVDLYRGSGGHAASAPAGDLVFEWLFEVNRWIPRRRPAKGTGP